MTVDNGAPAPVITSAGALVDGLHSMGAKKIALICPYMKPLAQLVIDYIEDQGIEVEDSIALEIPDNIEVGRRDPAAPVEIVSRLKTSNLDVIVASACVQMPPLASLPLIEARYGLPTVSAASCTTHFMLKSLGLEASAPNAGAILS